MTFHTTINSSITGDGAIKYHFSEEASFHFLYLQISTYLLSKQTKKKPGNRALGFSQSWARTGNVKMRTPEIGNCQLLRPKAHNIIRTI